MAMRLATFTRRNRPCFQTAYGRMRTSFGTGAITSLRRILTGLAVKEVQEPVLIAGDFDESRLAECEELGLTIAAGLEAGVF